MIFYLQSNPPRGFYIPQAALRPTCTRQAITFVLVRACSNFTILTQAQQADAHTEDESDSSVPHTWSVEFKSKNQYETVGSVGHKVLSLLCNDAFDPRYMMDGDRGCVHVLESPQYPGYVQIGRIETNPGDPRRRQTECGIKLILLDPYDQCNTRVPYHTRLEEVIHMDLWNEHHTFECPCPTKTDDSAGSHGEWFQIDKHEAVRRVHDWTEWMCQEPYNAQGSLEAAWMAKIEDFQQDLNLGDRLLAEDETKEWWKSFRQPTEGERHQPVRLSQSTIMRLRWSDLTCLFVSHAICLWLKASTRHYLSLCGFLALESGYLSLSRVLTYAAMAARDRLRSRCTRDDSLRLELGWDGMHFCSFYFVSVLFVILILF